MASMSNRASMAMNANTPKPYFDKKFCETIINSLNSSTGGLPYNYRIDNPDIYFHVKSDDLSKLVTTILDKIEQMLSELKKSSEKPKNSILKRASKVVKNAVTRKNNKTNKNKTQNNNKNNTKNTDLKKFQSLCIHILLLLKYENDISKDGTNITQQVRDDNLIQIRTYLTELCKFFNNKKFFNFTEKGKTKVISIVYVSISHIAYIDYQERMSALRTSMLGTARSSNAMSVQKPSTARPSNSRFMSGLNLPSALTTNPKKQSFFNSLTPEAQRQHNDVLRAKIAQNKNEHKIHVEIRTFLDDYIKENNLNDKSSDINIDSFNAALNNFLDSKKEVFSSISKNNPIKIFDRADQAQFKYFQLLKLLQKKDKEDKDYEKIKRNITEIINSNPEIYRTN